MMWRNLWQLAFLGFVCYQQVLVHGSVETKRKASKARADGDSLLVSGNVAGALGKYAEAITLEPHEVKNYLKSYKANDRLKRVDACIRDLTLAIEHDKEKKELSNSLTLRANLYSSLGKCREAVADWDQVLILKPGTQDVLDHRDRAAKCADFLERAERLLEEEKWEEADSLLTQAIDASKTTLRI
jgi:tetratricopeptide (TPR) repeat protein